VSNYIPLEGAPGGLPFLRDCAVLPEQYSSFAHVRSNPLSSLPENNYLYESLHFPLSKLQIFIDHVTFNSIRAYTPFLLSPRFFLLLHLYDSKNNSIFRDLRGLHFYKKKSITLVIGF
jgi:hypothetical protein